MPGITPDKSVVTPRGVAIFPRLNQPSTKFDAAGVYEVKLRLTADDAEGLASTIDKMIAAEHAAVIADLEENGKKTLAKKVVQADSPLQPEEDEEGEETGFMVLKAKTKASGVTKAGKSWERKPTIVNAKGTALNNPPNIGGGSEMKLSVTLAPYFMSSTKSAGVSVRLEGVQLLKLVSFGARDASSLGFGEEEGDDIDDQAPSEMDAGNDSDDGDDEDGL